MIGNGMPQIGDVVAEKYRLEKVAGEGGMGIVYAAEHVVLKQRVAVKVLLPTAITSDATVERFAREARAAAKINSEHVARVLDAGSTDNGSPFLVMEYLEGCDLEELLQLQRTLTVEDTVDYAVQALEGLAHAHAANIVHRDLKPANLFLGTMPDGTNAIKLLDFGISKAKGMTEDKRLTGQHVLGSPVYMSPEQLRNSTDIDGRADIWSIGVVMYEMLSGATPFDGDGVGEIFAAILEKDPIPLIEKHPKIPLELSDIITKCLRRDPDERWRDAGQLARALSPFASESQRGNVERAEQVLARAKHMHAMRTPLETQRVVEAIEAATMRAIANGRKSEPLLLTRPKEDAVTRADGTPTRIGLFARRSPLRAAVIGLAFCGVVIVAVFGVVRRARPASALALTPARELPRALASEQAKVAAVIASATPSDAPLVIELPPTPNTDKAPQARGAKAKGGKPLRPKFLNSRE